MAQAQQVLCLALLSLYGASASQAVSFRVQKHDAISRAKELAKEIKCPAPIFVAECTDDGTCFCVCKDKETCPSLAIILEPEEAAKKFQEAYEWVKNGSPWTKAALLQAGAQGQGREVVCPAPVFVPETLDTGITVCVCKLGDKCPSTVKVLDPEEAAKLAQEAFQWVENGAPYSLAQFGGREIKCPAPIFVAECTDDGTCFC